MNSKTCKDCGAWQHNTYREWHYCAQGQGDIRSGNSKVCKYFKPCNYFQKITASPDVLAENVVYSYEMAIGGGMFRIYWTSPFTENLYASKEEATTATLEGLKEVAE